MLITATDVDGLVVRPGSVESGGRRVDSRAKGIVQMTWDVSKVRLGVVTY
jgi:hypothetical protein